MPTNRTMPPEVSHGPRGSPHDAAADNGDAPPAIAPKKSTRSPNGVYEFREERWVELPRPAGSRWRASPRFYAVSS
jgi:hypothetical protein